MDEKSNSTYCKPNEDYVCGRADPNHKPRDVVANLEKHTNSKESQLETKHHFEFDDETDFEGPNPRRESSNESNICDTSDQSYNDPFCLDNINITSFFHSPKESVNDENNLRIPQNLQYSLVNEIKSVEIKNPHPFQNEPKIGEDYHCGDLKYLSHMSQMREAWESDQSYFLYPASRSNAVKDKTSKLREQIKQNQEKIDPRNRRTVPVATVGGRDVRVDGAPKTRTRNSSVNRGERGKLEEREGTGSNHVKWSVTRGSGSRGSTTTLNSVVPGSSKLGNNSQNKSTPQYYPIKPQFLLSVKPSIEVEEMSRSKFGKMSKSQHGSRTSPRKGASLQNNKQSSQLLQPRSQNCCCATCCNNYCGKCGSWCTKSKESCQPACNKMAQSEKFNCIIFFVAALILLILCICLILYPILDLFHRNQAKQNMQHKNG